MVLKGIGTGAENRDRIKLAKGLWEMVFIRGSMWFSETGNKPNN